MFKKRKAAEAVKYEGVGTVEFLVDKHKNFYFMEMNTRIQVEHPITEEVINYDLVREQIKVAAGITISGKNYEPKLHAIECRINAEDPYNDFRPSPGKITNFLLLAYLNNGLFPKKSVSALHIRILLIQ